MVVALSKEQAKEKRTNKGVPFWRDLVALRTGTDITFDLSVFVHR